MALEGSRRHSLASRAWDDRTHLNICTFIDMQPRVLVEVHVYFPPASSLDLKYLCSPAEQREIAGGLTVFLLLDRKGDIPARGTSHRSAPLYGSPLPRSESIPSADHRRLGGTFSLPTIIHSTARPRSRWHLPPHSVGRCVVQVSLGALRERRPTRWGTVGEQREQSGGQMRHSPTLAFGYRL